MDLEFLNKNWNILVIDDSRLNRAIVKKTLLELGLNVDEAADGLEGLEELSNKQYDLILVDIIMPNLDGFGFLEQFKDIIDDNFIPVILMTGSDDLNSKIKGLRIGADDFLIKPLNEKELVARVLSLLRLKSMHSELYQKNQLIKKELEVAKKIQSFIIPENFAHIKYPDISGSYLPIEEIGGDYFDCYQFPDEKLGFVIADVTGHGIPAAMVMTMSKMIFNVYTPNFKNTADLLTKVNKEFRGILLDSQYITAFYLIYDNDKKTIKFTNAGHTKALYHRYATDKILGLDTEGYFIGISDETNYEEKQIRVEKNDRLFLYTDGISEIKNSEKEEYGDSRLAKFIKKFKDADSNQFCKSLLEEVNDFTSLDNRDDDIAFVSVKF